MDDDKSGWCLAMEEEDDEWMTTRVDGAECLREEKEVDKWMTTRVDGDKSG